VHDAPLGVVTPTPTGRPDRGGRVALVTGGNAGIGLETTRGLVERGFRVVVAARDEARMARAAEDVARSTGRDAVETMRLDLSVMADVRRFADACLARHDKLDALVLNAGVHTARRERTPEGFERTFATNHLGHFLLARLLHGALARAAPSRVVVVASEAHRFGRMHWGDLMLERRWSGLAAYTQSKLANVLFARDLARRWADADVRVNAVHPGSVRSGWARGRESGVFRFGVALASPFLLSPRTGARAALRLATDPALADATGRYFDRRGERTPSREARDDDAAQRLWDESARLLKL